MASADRKGCTSAQSFDVIPMSSFSTVQAGVGYWLTDYTQVRQLAEQLAKAQFTAKRDPHDCALMYIALGKKMLLQVICLPYYSNNH